MNRHGSTKRLYARLGLLVFLSAFGWVAECCAQQTQLAGVPYTPDKPIAGELEIIGSTEMQQVAALWVDGFRKVHPDIKVQIDCQGSEQAYPKLASGKTLLGLASRKLTNEEVSRISEQLGAPLIAVTVGFDVLAVIVHKENPIDGLRWNPKLGTPLALPDGTIATHWGGLGVDPPLADQALAAHVLSKKHALRVYAERILAGGAASESIRLHEYDTPNDIIAGIANDPAGIGLVSGTRGVFSKVKPLTILVDTAHAVAPNDPFAVEKGYPLLRELTLVVATDTNGKRDEVSEEFITYVLSRLGQDTLSKDGFVPLDPSQLRAQQEALGWEVMK